MIFHVPVTQMIILNNMKRALPFTFLTLFFVLQTRGQQPSDQMHEQAFIKKMEDMGGEEMRNRMVKFIVNQVVNITRQKMASSSPQEKQRILAQMRTKLDRISASMGPGGDKYTELVMEGIQATVDGSGRRTGSLMEPKPNDNKNLLVRAIAQKIQTLAKTAFKKAKTAEDRQEILATIKRRVIEAAKKHNVMIRSKDKSVKPYSQLVIEGVELVLRQGVSNDTERRSEMNVRTSEIKDEILQVFPGNNTTTPKEPELDLCGCSCIIEKTCNKIITMNKFTCSHSKKIVTLDKLCDGIPDCPDRSDEQQCTKNAIKKLRSSSNVIGDIEAVLPRKCLKTTLEREVLTTQNVVLSGVLQQQIDFMNKYEPTKTSTMQSKREIKEVVAQVGVVVSTVSLALQAAFCTHEREDVISRRNGEEDIDWDFNELLIDRSWAPPACTCKGQFCVQQNCTDACKHTCWQRYSLSRWSCPAVTTEKTVSLDLICDGKIDCFDESDETGCSTGNGINKFEARDIFNIILKVLTSQIQVSEFVPVLNRFNTLQELVKVLLVESTKDRVDVARVKNLRVKCFAEITTIYESILVKADLVEKVDETYILLMSISEKLVNAMKRSNTGNERIVQSDECLCRETSCATPVCSPLCHRACAVKPQFTHYTCRGTNNTGIPLDGICNGKLDCTSGDDEEHCSQDICRNHHLVLLRNEVQKLKVIQPGTVVGESIKAWKHKVIANLAVKEKIARSTRRVIVRMVNDAVHDLLMTYASIGDSHRRTKGKASVEDFMQYAKPIQEVLRTCTK